MFIQAQEERFVLAASESSACGLGKDDQAWTQPHSMLALVLNEMECGLMLVTVTGQVRYANRVAHRALALAVDFVVRDEKITLRDEFANAKLHQALRTWRVGKRVLVNAFDETHRQVSIAVIPLALACDCALGDVVALLTMGKDETGNPLSFQFFAQSHGLTGAESTTLRGLCQGLRSKEIAQKRGVAVSTVRTQIRSLAQKTQTNGIRDMVSKVSSMPPMACAV